MRSSYLNLSAFVLMLACATSHTIGQCTQPASNCQGFDTATGVSALGPTGGYNADLAWATVADDFFAASAGSISSVCFYGRYRIPPGSGTTEPTATAETFRVRYLGNLSPGNVPDVNNVLASFTVGGTTPTAGTTLTRSGTLANAAAFAATADAAGATIGRVWTATHPAVNVAAGQRVWIEIACTSSATDGGNRFRWLLSNNPTLAPFGDNRVASAVPNGSYLAVNATSGDLAFCVDVALAGTSVPLASNALCVGATSLATPSIASPTVADFTGTSSRGGIEPNGGAPFCKSSPVSGPTLWYSVVGNGTTLTASTCVSQTNFDTVINVYCGSCAGPTGAQALNCVASNDSGGTGCTGGTGSNPSRISFVGTAGVEYKLAVFGFNGAAGAFRLTLTTDGTVATNQPACVSDRCPLTGLIAGIPPVNVEADACGAETNSQCTAPGVRTVALGQSYTGFIENVDVDYWELAPALSAGGWVRATVNVEFPGLFSALTGTCGGIPLNGTTTNLGSFFRVVNYCTPGEFFIQSDASGRLRFVLAANTSSIGVPCSAQSNRYVFRADTVITGGCCVGGQACSITPQAVCTSLGGTYRGDNSTCAPIGPGGTIDQCLPVRCCRGTTCANVPFAFQCAPVVAGGTTIGVTLSTAVNCNAGGSTRVPCCFADFDKSGLATIDDVFVYLGAWFAQSPWARVGGNGTGVPTIDDIFSFLSAWFAGC